MSNLITDDNTISQAERELPGPGELAMMAEEQSYESNERGVDEGTDVSLVPSEDGDIEFFVKSDLNDERYIVKIGDMFVATFGSVNENYALTRLAVNSDMLQADLFDYNQVEKGNLARLEEPPQELSTQLDRLVDSFSRISQSISDYNPI
jgi:hypothetical protein